MFLSKLNQEGFSILENIFTTAEIEAILQALSKKDLAQQFGVRYFLKEHSDLIPLVFTLKFKQLIQAIDAKAFVIKSIYFDKPPHANWIVNWHQDIAINVEGKTADTAYTKWRTAKGRTAVQPPIEVLENIFTLRIHLDDCTIQNGALQVIPKSHLNGVIRVSELSQSEKANATVCEVKQGGVLAIKPLIFHASKRVENLKSRRVLHLEFTSEKLADGVNWLEQLEFN